MPRGTVEKRLFFVQYHQLQCYRIVHATVATSVANASAIASSVSSAAQSVSPSMGWADFNGALRKPNLILQRERVAKAGNVSAKLYQLYAMIADEDG